MKGHKHDEKLIKYLQLQAVRARKWIIEMTYRARSGHPGGSLSAVDAIVALYHHHMRHNPKNPKDPDRDRFILSKGHAAPALYAVLAQCGYFDEKELLKLRQVGAMLQGHPAVRTPGVEVATGSLGQGLSFGVGVALAGKLDKKDYHVYVLIGDGESEEGQIWEAASIASHYKLDNLIALLDRNELQIDGTTEEIYGLEPIEKRWEAFGWNVMKINGHDFKQILDALDEACSLKNGKPTMIIMKTIKGKGVSFMEGNLRFHGVAPNDEEYKIAMRELDEAEKRILEEGDGGED